eukprot:scaffold37085_cov29-Prasinocladus_malaysianus.AAC.1
MLVVLGLCSYWTRGRYPPRRRSPSRRTLRRWPGEQTSERELRYGGPLLACYDRSDQQPKHPSPSDRPFV